MASKKPPVVRCYNNPAISNTAKLRYTLEGKFVADYTSGWSADGDDAEKSSDKTAAQTTFDTMRMITNFGGRGFISDTNTDLYAVGRWSPNCASFHLEENSTEGDDDIKLKAIQMSEYAIVHPDDKQYAKLRSANHRTGRNALKELEDSGGVIDEVLDELELEGRLRTVVQ